MSRAAITGWARPSEDEALAAGLASIHRFVARTWIDCLPPPDRRYRMTPVPGGITAWLRPHC